MRGDRMGRGHGGGRMVPNYEDIAQFFPSSAGLPSFSHRSTAPHPTPLPPLTSTTEMVQMAQHGWGKHSETTVIENVIKN